MIYLNRGKTVDYTKDIYDISLLLNSCKNINNKCNLIYKLLDYIQKSSDIKQIDTIRSVIEKYTKEDKYLNETLVNNVGSLFFIEAGDFAFKLGAYTSAEYFFSIVFDRYYSNGNFNRYMKTEVFAFMIRKKLMPNKDYSLYDALLTVLDYGYDEFGLINLILILAYDLHEDIMWKFLDWLLYDSQLVLPLECDQIWPYLSEEEKKTIHLLLMRHKIISTSPYGSVNEIYDSLQSKNISLPDFVKYPYIPSSESIKAIVFSLIEDFDESINNIDVFINSGTLTNEETQYFYSLKDILDLLNQCIKSYYPRRWFNKQNIL